MALLRSNTRGEDQILWQTPWLNKAWAEGMNSLRGPNSLTFLLASRVHFSFIQSKKKKKMRTSEFIDACFVFSTPVLRFLYVAPRNCSHVCLAPDDWYGNSFVIMDLLWTDVSFDRGGWAPPLWYVSNTIKILLW